MGRYGRHCEQCYRQNFGRLRSKSLNWFRFNAALALRYFGTEGRKAVGLMPLLIVGGGKNRARGTGRLPINEYICNVIRSKTTNHPSI